jgi:GTP pyrophosphokinase
VLRFAAQDEPRRLAANRAVALSQIVAELKADDDIVLGALLYPLLDAGLLPEPEAILEFGDPATRIAQEIVRLGHFGTPAHWRPGQALPGAQAEALRKMLLAVVTDARLILIRLADQLHRLRSCKDAPEAERQRIALETREIYAPLANRLGIWQLKWELEDLSFRYLEPEVYKRIAGWLAAKRADRENYIGEVIRELQVALGDAGIKAIEIAGRPKHIYSIWRKMQRKNLAFEELYDLRAVRILVDSVADCYAALGVVHSLWPYIRGEFDDYIATPKENQYRSLHTAVIGPGKLPLEVQIRTLEMHEHAELGLAAHWVYKEGGRAHPAYEQKINWLRQLLEPAAPEGARPKQNEPDLLEQMRAEIFEDRVYALSPRGEVIDLPRGATPLDFAYHVHTDLGHRCRGAKVNGRMVPLNQPLVNGDQVEIVTGKQLSPSRDWLVPSLGYLVSQRNRGKVRAWFRKQDEEQNLVQGRQILERELQRLAIHTVTVEDLLAEFNLADAKALYLALGEGELTVAQIAGAMQRRAKPQELPSAIARKPIREVGKTGITVDGVGDLLSHFARCCRPVPPEPISGYITLGRGVSIHREQCPNALRLGTQHPERVIAVEWGQDTGQTFALDVNVLAYDRRGLVRDITAVLADAKINIHSMSTQTHEQDGIADMTIRLSVHGLTELSRALARIQGLPNVISARRKA